MLIFSFPDNLVAPKNENLAFQIKDFSQNDFFYIFFYTEQLLEINQQGFVECLMIVETSSIKDA